MQITQIYLLVSELQELGINAVLTDRYDYPPIAVVHREEVVYYIDTEIDMEYPQVMAPVIHYTKVLDNYCRY